jgi:hypothetical protein
VVLFFYLNFFGRHATYADGGAMGPKVPFLVAIHALEAFSKVVEANLSPVGEDAKEFQNRKLETE